MGKITHGKTIGTAKVISNDLIEKGASICGRKLASIGYITLHNTGLVDVKANNFHKSLKRENALTNGRQASWTLTVDDMEIYQEVPLDWETWHAGNSTGNKNSISIEMCMWSDKEKQRKTYDNAARLVVELMKMYNIPLTNVVQHHKWSGKNCPQYLRENKHGFNWSWFMELIKKYYTGTNANISTEKISGEIIVLVDNLNVRKDADFGSSIIKTIKKDSKHKIIEKKNGFYRLSDSGWCSAGDKYVKYTETTEENTYEVTASSLNVRNGRGVEHKIVGSLKKGDKIVVWSFADDNKGQSWASFRYSFNPDVIGYVSKKYLREVK